MPKAYMNSALSTITNKPLFSSSNLISDVFAFSVQLTSAKLLPMPPSGRREGGGIYSVTVDGLEIARAYSGATNQTITFE